MLVARADGLMNGQYDLDEALACSTHRVINDAASAMFQQGDFSMLSPSIFGDVVDGLLSR